MKTTPGTSIMTKKTKPTKEMKSSEGIKPLEERQSSRTDDIVKIVRAECEAKLLAAKKLYEDLEKRYEEGKLENEKLKVYNASFQETQSTIIKQNEFLKGKLEGLQIGFSLVATGSAKGSAKGYTKKEVGKDEKSPSGYAEEVASYSYNGETKRTVPSSINDIIKGEKQETLLNEEATMEEDLKVDEKFREEYNFLTRHP